MVPYFSNYTEKDTKNKISKAALSIFSVILDANTVVKIVIADQYANNARFKC